MEQFIYKDNKKLRCGYTTGSCAAAAAQRATALLLGAGVKEEEPISITTPKGVLLKIPVSNQEKGDDWARCVVQKDSGDDPDVTNGILIYATVRKATEINDSQIIIKGGIGIGKVTKAGLACPVGEWAINPTPRRMIEEEVKSVCHEFEYEGKLLVEISIPQGVEIAKRTYNPRLGITGGISILGSSGIVEPMSEQALIDTIKVEMNMKKASGVEYLVITPGNYGEAFLKTYPEIPKDSTIKCSNFIGDALDYAERSAFKGVLLVGHIGKFIKVAAGVMNTHSKYADVRMEVFVAHAGLAGGSKEILEKILSCVTSEEAIAVLDEAGIREEIIKSVLKKLDFHIKERVHHNLEIGAILFSNKYGYLGETEDVKKIIKKLG